MMAFLCLLFACREDEGVMGGEDPRLPIDLSGEIDQVMLSRVNDGGFCDQDVIGVYIVDYEGGNPGELALEGNRASNVQFTYKMRLIINGAGRMIFTGRIRRPR